MSAVDCGGVLQRCENESQECRQKDDSNMFVSQVEVVLEDLARSMIRTWVSTELNPQCRVLTTALIELACFDESRRNSNTLYLSVPEASTWPPVDSHVTQVSFCAALACRTVLRKARIDALSCKSIHGILLSWLPTATRLVFIFDTR